MAQASKSQNDALNTFIVVGAFVVFGVLCITITVGRIFVQRSCMQDIPKRYIPLVSEDMPHKGSRNLILKQMSRSQKLNNLFQKPKDHVIHDGVAPPIYAHDVDGEVDTTEVLPAYLNYEESIKIITSRLKYQGVFTNIMTLDLERDDTFAEIVHSLFGNNKKCGEEIEEYIDLYETIRFSGKEISQEQFLRFMDLSLYFVDIILTTNNDNKKVASGYRRKSNHATHLSVSSSLENGQNSKLTISPVNTDDYFDTDSASQSDSDTTERSNMHEEAPTEMNRLRKVNTSETVARRVASNCGLQGPFNYDLDESQEPPESQKDFNRCRNILSKMESYKSVVQQSPS